MWGMNQQDDEMCALNETVCINLNQSRLPKRAECATPKP